MVTLCLATLAGTNGHTARQFEALARRCQLVAWPTRLVADALALLLVQNQWGGAVTLAHAATPLVVEVESLVRAGVASLVTSALARVAVELLLVRTCGLVFALALARVSVELPSGVALLHPRTLALARLLVKPLHLGACEDFGTALLTLTRLGVEPVVVGTRLLDTDAATSLGVVIVSIITFGRVGWTPALTCVVVVDLSVQAVGMRVRALAPAGILVEVLSYRTLLLFAHTFTCDWVVDIPVRTFRLVIRTLAFAGVVVEDLAVVTGGMRIRTLTLACFPV